MQNSILKRIVSLEYLVVAILIAVFYIVVGGFAWYWLVVLFLVFDISAAGYLVNPKVGAFLYNLGHSLIGPSLLAAIYIGTSNQAVLFVTLVWLFHIFVDRALGYGLKHSTSFNHTHLGPIGKAEQK
jgi:hypothetical protein